MPADNIIIRQGTIEEVVQVSRQIPEFENPAGADIYHTRLDNVDHLISIAESNKPCAFKVGYDRDADGSFYSWMGGVLPEARRKGIAQRLADEMEIYCRSKGYSTLKMKTRNEHKAMIQCAIRNGFHITGFKAYPDPMKSRILLEKPL
ncbi:MAG: GNAT family N-acetyltransferase [Bacteroidota bacterium]